MAGRAIANDDTVKGTRKEARDVTRRRILLLKGGVTT
jgi:hypothetical protein